MANKRMFTMKIVDSDEFLDMPLSAQCLYFHLNMRADDDGFINSPRKVMKIIGANDDDLKILLAKRFVLAFDNGVIVIKHWRMHNTIGKTRYTETQYTEEKNQLLLKDNGAYSFTNGTPLDDGRTAKMFKDVDENEECSPNVLQMFSKCSPNVLPDKDLDLDIGLGLDKDLDTSKVQSNRNNTLTVNSTSMSHEDEEIFIELPLKDGTQFPVTYKYIQEMEQLYPSVDVLQEFRSMKGWLCSDDKRLKTPRGIKKFITGWLNRNQKEASVQDDPQKSKWQEVEEVLANRKKGLFDF